MSLIFEVNFRKTLYLGMDGNSSLNGYGHRFFSTTNMSSKMSNGTSIGHGVKDHPYIPLYIYILVSVFNSVIFILGIFGNVLVLLVIAKVRSMRTPTNFFLMSLSIADILVLLVCQPAALMEFFAKDRWFIGRTMCEYNVSMTIVHTIFEP